MSIPIFFPAIGNSINQNSESSDPVAVRAEGQLYRSILGSMGITLTARLCFESTAVALSGGCGG